MSTQKSENAGALHAGLDFCGQVSRGPKYTFPTDTTNTSNSHITDDTVHHSRPAPPTLPAAANTRNSSTTPPYISCTSTSATAPQAPPAPLLWLPPTRAACLFSPLSRSPIPHRPPFSALLLPPLPPPHDKHTGSASPLQTSATHGESLVIITAAPKVRDACTPALTLHTPTIQTECQVPWP